MIKSVKFLVMGFLLDAALCLSLIPATNAQDAPNLSQVDKTASGILNDHKPNIGKTVKVVQQTKRRNGGPCTNATTGDNREVFCYKDPINREYYEFDYSRPNPQTKRLVLSEFDPSKMRFIKTAVVEMRFNDGFRHTSVDLIEDDKPSFHVATTFRAGDGRTDEADLILVLETGMDPVIPEPYKKGYELVFKNFTDQIEQSPVSARQLDGDVIQQVGPPKVSQLTPPTPPKPREMTEGERKQAQAFLDKFVTNNDALSAEAKRKLAKLALSTVDVWVNPNITEIHQDGNKITIKNNSGVTSFYYLDEMK